jgi:hypothetical protein
MVGPAVFEGFSVAPMFSISGESSLLPSSRSVWLRLRSIPKGRVVAAGATDNGRDSRAAALSYGGDNSAGLWDGTGRGQWSGKNVDSCQTDRVILNHFRYYFREGRFVSFSLCILLF